MARPKVKALIFDLGGVVVFGGYLHFIHHYIAKHLSKKTKKRIEFLEHQINLGNLSETAFYNHLAKEFNVHLTPKQMHDKIVKKMKTNQSLVQYIPKLKKTKIALFSNSLGHMAAETLRARHLSGKKVFDRIFFSSTMHMAKPSIESYRYVARHLKIKPHEALMIDDRSGNITAAKKAGLQGITYKNLPQFKRALRRYDLI
jgi:HAD superfamily hydrolase (TIGR01509 family)